jgi:hypothetical protein
MLHRLRLAFADTTIEPMGGEGIIVETDITIAGGKTKTMSNKKRKAFKGDRNAAMANKTAISAYVERGGNVRFDVVDSNENEPDLVRTHIDSDSVLMTDTANTYIAVGKEYAAHLSVDHSKSEYVRGIAHTNTIEGVFSLFDRMVVGIYHFVSPKHMQAYCNESAFRYNSRKITDKARFDLALIKTNGVKLHYATLIAK